MRLKKQLRKSQGNDKLCHTEICSDYVADATASTVSLNDEGREHNRKRRQEYPQQRAATGVDHPC